MRKALCWQGRTLPAPPGPPRQSCTWRSSAHPRGGHDGKLFMSLIFTNTDHRTHPKRRHRPPRTRTHPLQLFSLYDGCRRVPAITQSYRIPGRCAHVSRRLARALQLYLANCPSS